MWPFSKPPSWLGVDIGAAGIKLVQLVKKNKRAHLFTFGYTQEHLGSGPDYAENALDVEKTASVLKKVCAKAKVTTKKVLASLPVSSVLTSLVSIPRLAKKEADMFVRREAEKLSPLPLAEMALEWNIIKRPGVRDTDEVLITAASKKTIKIYSEIFKLAGLQLISLEAETYALINALAGKDTSPLIIIDIGASQTDFFLVESGAPILTHSIALGGRTFSEVISRTMNVDLAAAEQIKLDLSSTPHPLEKGEGGFPKVFDNTVAPIIDGINYLFDIYAKQSGQSERPEKIILTGGGSLLTHLDDHLAKLFSIKVYVGDPWARVIYDERLKPTVDAIGTKFSVALGLGIKKIES